jgi:hypothetical protein
VTPAELLDLELPENDSGATTVRGYLAALLAELWREEADFSGKRPFGNSSWQGDIYQPMIRAGIVPGTFDEDGYLDTFTQDAERQADKLILAAISALGRPAGTRKRAGTGNAGGGRDSGPGSTGKLRDLTGGASAGSGMPRKAVRHTAGSDTESEFPPSVKALIKERDEGCVLRGVEEWGLCLGPVDAHHRRLIGSGGSTAPETHRASNGIQLCRGHHDAVHRQRLKAEGYGLIISRYARPAEAPLRILPDGVAQWLDDDGNYLDHPPGPEDGAALSIQPPSPTSSASSAGIWTQP